MSQGAQPGKNARKKALREGGPGYVKVHVKPDADQAQQGDSSSPKQVTEPCASAAKTAVAKPPEKPKTYQISGTVRDTAGQGLGGVTVTFTAGGQDTTRDDGSYTIANLPAGANGALRPSLGRKVFDPPQTDIVNLQADQPNVDFAQRAFQISGKIVARGNANPPAYFLQLLSKAVVTLSGGQNATHAGSQPYSFNGLPSGDSYTVECKVGEMRLGAAKTVAALDGDVPWDFEVPVYAISGKVDKLVLPAEAAGTTINVTCGDAKVTVDLNDDGTYNVPDLPSGLDYFVRASKDQFTILGRGAFKPLAANANIDFAVKVFTATGVVKNSGNPVPGVDIQVAGLRNLTGTVLTVNNGIYTVELPSLTAGAYTLKAVKADMEFDKVKSDQVSDAKKTDSQTADFKAVLENVEVTIVGADKASRDVLSRDAGTVGTGTNYINQLTVSLTGGPGKKKTAKAAVGSTKAIFQNVLKGPTYQVQLDPCPGFFNCPQQDVADAKATLTVTLQSFTLSGTITKVDRRTGAVANFPGCTVRLKQGGALKDTQTTGGAGQYQFVAVPGAEDYTVEVDLSPPANGQPYYTFCPQNNPQTGYRTFELEQLEASCANLDFVATACIISFNPGGEMIGTLWLNNIQKAVLSNEVIRSLQGDRPGKPANEIASHKVRMDIIADAIDAAYAKNQAETSTEYNLPAYALKLIFRAKHPREGNFIGNVITVYHV